MGEKITNPAIATLLEAAIIDEVAREKLEDHCRRLASALESVLLSQAYGVPTFGEILDAMDALEKVHKDPVIGITIDSRLLEED